MCKVLLEGWERVIQKGAGCADSRTALAAAVAATAAAAAPGAGARAAAAAAAAAASAALTCELQWFQTGVDSILEQSS